MLKIFGIQNVLRLINDSILYTLYSFFQKVRFLKLVVFIQIVVSLTLVNDDPSLTIVKDDKSLTIVNEEKKPT